LKEYRKKVIEIRVIDEHAMEDVDLRAKWR